jgi:hypothetical protein
MTECRDLYSACLRAGRDFGVAADEAFPDGRCERVAISQHSPGPVHPCEKLTRLVIHPIHISNDGKPVPVIFNDAWNNDLSLFRETKAADGEIALALTENRATGQKRNPPQDRSFVGVMYARAHAIRGAAFDSHPKPAFRVYDTGEQNKPNHASVFMSKAGREQLTVKKVRKKLWEIFGQALAEEGPTYRGGRLSMPAQTA